MVSVQKSDSKFNVSESAIAGGAAGAITRAICHPLDVLKIRFQLQLEPIYKGSKYSSMYQAVNSIIKEEGITTLWSGHVPAQLLSISFGVIQFTTYEHLTRKCLDLNTLFYNSNKHWINFTNGAVAATCATVASFPFDTVRTRLIAEQKTNKAYKGFVNACNTMVKKEGVHALFKGLLPTLGQVAPYAGSLFCVYKLCTDVIFNKIQYFQRFSNTSVNLNILGNLLSGSIAGIVSKTVIYPFDLVKKRLQIQGFQQYRSAFGRQMYCKGMFHCVRLTIADEGFLALYKGYIPSMFKATLVTALHFAIYDEIKHFILRI